MTEIPTFEFNILSAGVNIQHVATFQNPVKWTQPLPGLCTQQLLYDLQFRDCSFSSCQQNNLFYIVTGSFSFAFVLFNPPILWNSL